MGGQVGRWLWELRQQLLVPHATAHGPLVIPAAAEELRTSPSKHGPSLLFLWEELAQPARDSLGGGGGQGVRTGKGDESR